MRSAHLKADIALVLTTLIWGSTFVIAKDILTYWPPLAYITVRFVVAALALAIIFRRDILKVNRSAWVAGLTLGGLVIIGFNLQAIGQVYTTASKSAFITGLTTPLVPLVAFAVLRVRPTVGNTAGVVLASIGGWLFLVPRAGEASNANLGDILTLVCTLVFALHITMISFYTARFNTRQLTVLPIIVAAALSGLVWIMMRLSANIVSSEWLPQFVLNELTPLVWTWRVSLQVLYLAIVATVITFLLWTWGQARLSATRAAIIFSLEPVFATLFAVAVRGHSEWIGGSGIVGAALILVAVIVSESRFSRRKRELETASQDQLDSESPRLSEGA